MGLFSNLFKQQKTDIRVIYGNNNNSKSALYTGQVYEQETVRAIIDCIATHAAKAEAMHIILDADGRVKEIKRNSPYVKLLNLKPNNIMSGYDLKYKMVTHLETTTTAMCYIKWNWQEKIPEMIAPIYTTNFEIYPITTGGYAVQFTDYDGILQTLLLEDVVLIKKYFNSLDVGGDGNAPVYNALNLQSSADAGLLDAVSVSNKFRGMYKQKKAGLDPADTERLAREFESRITSAAAAGGIIALDSMEDYQPLTVTQWAAEPERVKEIRENIMRYWRISDSILMSKYSESEWQAFYESVIEPILIQLGQAFTNACFTQKEQDFGNRIVFNSSVLLNTSIPTKVNILRAAKETGLFSKNELREMFGYSPVVGGDEFYVSLNYVKGSDQTKYQTGTDEENTGETDTNDTTDNTGEEF